MIKEQNKKILLTIAFIFLAIAIVIRFANLVYMLIRGYNFGFISEYIFVIYSTPLVLLLLTFIKKKNIKLDLIFIVLIIQLSDLLLRIKSYDTIFILGGLLGNISLLAATILIILLLLNVFKDYYWIKVIKIVIISLCSLNLLNEAYLTISYRDFLSIIFNFLNLLVFGFRVLLVLQIDPVALNIERPSKSLYTNSIMNLLLLLTFNSFIHRVRIFDDTYIYLVIIIIIISIQGIISFYGKEIISKLVTIVLFILYLIYFLFSVEKLFIYEAPIIFLVLGIIINAILFRVDIKKSDLLNE